MTTIAAAATVTATAATSRVDWGWAIARIR
jgi:hypothetical protein